MADELKTFEPMSKPKKQKNRCLNCGGETARPSYKYCSNICQNKYQRSIYIKKWKTGEISGLQNQGIVSTSVKIYLREKFNNKCVVCGWSKVNQTTRKVPLVADHIDGNWKNNIESNLRLICPNCDSLNSTYGGLNKGNGRKNRVESKRTKEAKLLIKKTGRYSSVVEHYFRKVGTWVRFPLSALGKIICI